MIFTRSKTGPLLASAGILLAMMVCAGAAAAQGQPASAWIEKLPVKPSESDIARLAAFEAHREQAIAEAMGGEAPSSDKAVLQKVLAGAPQPITGKELLGEWRCRTLKLGGQFLPLVVYGFFKCRVYEEDGALILRKITGSQRTRGVLARVSGDRFVYLGAGTVNDDPPLDYGDEPEKDEVAFLAKAAPARLRLEFPAPRLESRFDIIELVR